MTRITLSTGLAALIAICSTSMSLAEDRLVIQQDNTRNYVNLIQERNLFFTNNRTITATTGRTTVTEIVAIGPDPKPVSVIQAGVTNRAMIYQSGIKPNLDVQQTGANNFVRTIQYGMP